MQMGAGSDGMNDIERNHLLKTINNYEALLKLLFENLKNQDDLIHQLILEKFK